jgi:hypothetical protein
MSELVAVLVASGIIARVVLPVGVARLRLGVPSLLRAVSVLVNRTGMDRSVRLVVPAYLPIGIVMLVVPRLGIDRPVRPPVRVLVLTIGREVLLVLMLVLLVPVPCVSPAGLLVDVLGLVRLVLALRCSSPLPLVVRVGIACCQPPKTQA